MVRVDEVAAPAVAWPVRRRLLPVAGAFAGTVALFLGYLHMARELPTDADGASNALQAWDMLHGNPLLSGWTLSDVPFYSTELPQLALLELIRGYHPDVVHIAVAMSYTLLVVLAAALAKGRATGAAGLVRVGLAVAVMLLPARGVGLATVLSSPNHTGTAVPLLVTWLVLDRTLTRPDGEPRAAPRWLPYAITVLLVWGQVGDPLVTYVGALPLVIVSAFRQLRSREPAPNRLRSLDARLFVAGVASIVLTKGFLALLRLAGGFFHYAVPVEIAPLAELRHHAWVTTTTVAVVFGAYFPDLHGAVATTVGLLHVVAIAVVAAALVVALWRGLRRRHDDPGDRIAEILAVAIGINLGAFVITTMPSDVYASHEIVAVLSMGAALAGRIWGPRLVAPAPAGAAAPGPAGAGAPARPQLPAAVLALVAVLGVFGGAFVAQSVNGQPRPADREIADWLDAHGLRYGLGGYWNANSTTLTTAGRVQIVPVIGYQRIMAYRWESRADWYDPAKHDARFIVIDVTKPTYGTIEAATAQWGEPVERHDFGNVAVLRYDHNLLVGLVTFCGPQMVTTTDKCIGE
jgi:hypothetical protein